MSDAAAGRFPAVTGLRELRSSGSRLARADYLARFRAEYPHCVQVDKLESAQEFREPGYAPWEAARRGDWGAAVRLADAERPVLARQYEDARARGRRLRRVRLVELPPSDYVLWEMSILRLRAELGEEIKVIGGGSARTGSARTGLQHPPPAHMPELVLLGTTALYELLYTPEGDLDGAVRHTDQGLIEACRLEIEQLLAEGEELLAFHDRVTAPLLAGRVEGRAAR
ncbi:DUF6879 family protein [Streptomyces blattellae]|uniref:DUF6879 family protein n=1 Tax=Streptomyces blattellae TaxID=2569855 RepID=UPI0012B97BE5|nr:DUF6879 family protein [Streptomyces blattellae]